MSLTNLNGTICEDYNSSRPLTAGTTNLVLSLKNVINATENTITTLTSINSQSVIYCPQSTHNNSSTINVIKLPAPTSGFNCKIIFKVVGDNTSGHGWQITSTGANMIGTDIAVTGGLVPVQHTASTNLIRSGTAANALPNDQIQIDCDGTNYYFLAYSSGAASPYSVS